MLIFFIDNLIIHPSTLDVFQYLTDVEVNATINDDLVNEVCHTAQLNYCMLAQSKLHACKAHVGMFKG